MFPARFGRPKASFLATLSLLLGGFANPATYGHERRSSTPTALSTASLHHSSQWGRNINLLSIVYAFRPRLRAA